MGFFGFTIFDVEGNERRSKEKQNMQVYSREQKRWTTYEKLSFGEKADFDRRYPYSGQTYEEWCGNNS